ncbi:MAG: hypothetical protein K0R43_642 [Pseudoduganella sp.]|nr:hypothetical protein [Pseudoduganella sp.]
MGTTYRNDARVALDRARLALAAREDSNLRYAALELRMALECLVYERAQSYKEELSNKRLSTWQPKQLLNILLELNPNADKTSTISFGLEEEKGVPAKEMKLLGTDRVISLKEIKEYYDRLGSYLHAPTIEQAMQGKGSPGQKLRKSCEDLSNIIDSSLRSPVWNSDFKMTTSIDCEDCGTKIIRRVHKGQDRFEAVCIECSARYILTRTADDRFAWRADTLELACEGSECGEKITVQRQEIAENRAWTCRACGGENAIVLGVKFTPRSTSSPG